ncbi:glutamic acid-rich protein-like [Hydractinia symbiolongicarpus]|uniref:glutamic acid-rich protein-like n=1 Tax=Hydractinia symbiolongicarpus TaxID=13093 RepID=UPI0025507A4C|nr:glutamic acid-rich protein-like [Hydractinia symbiolongicarpus]XP_057308591.1 glutamic acid-rich protein-like [Hydractinia symbiolongicarpus]
MNHKEGRLLDQYNSLQDESLAHYFANETVQKHLLKAGLITKDGYITDESTHRLRLKLKKRQKEMRLLQEKQITERALHQQRMREHRAQKELEHALKVELVKKMRSERQCKSSKELISYLHQGRPDSTEKGRSTKLPKIGANNKAKKKTPKEKDNHRQTSGNKTFSKPILPPISKKKKGLSSEFTVKYVSRPLETSPREVQVIQQVGTSYTCVFKESLSTKSVFSFTLQRPVESRLNFTIAVNAAVNVRFNACCEYKCQPGCRIGGKNSQFHLVSIEGPVFCSRCQLYADEEQEEEEEEEKDSEEFKKSNKPIEKKDTSNIDVDSDDEEEMKGQENVESSKATEKLEEKEEGNLAIEEEEEEKEEEQGQEQEEEEESTNHMGQKDKHDSEVLVTEPCDGKHQEEDLQDNFDQDCKDDDITKAEDELAVVAKQAEDEDADNERNKLDSANYEYSDDDDFTTTEDGSSSTSDSEDDEKSPDEDTEDESTEEEGSEKEGLEEEDGEVQTTKVVSNDEKVIEKLSNRDEEAGTDEENTELEGKENKEGKGSGGGIIEQNGNDEDTAEEDASEHNNEESSKKNDTVEGGIGEDGTVESGEKRDTDQVGIGEDSEEESGEKRDTDQVGIGEDSEEESGEKRDTDQVGIEEDSTEEISKEEDKVEDKEEEGTQESTEKNSTEEESIGKKVTVEDNNKEQDANGSGVGKVLDSWLDLQISNVTLTQEKTNDVRDEILAGGIEKLKDILKDVNKVEKLHLPSTSITKEDVKHIADVISDPKHEFKSLALNGNPLGDEGITLLLEAMTKNDSITDLDIGGCNVSDKGAKSISSYLKANESLGELTLSKNGLTVTGWQHIADALKVNRSLKTLSIDSNNMLDDGVKAICDGISENKSLVSLDVEGNFLDDVAGEMIYEAIKRCETLVDVTLLPDNKFSDQILNKIRKLIYERIEEKTEASS